MTVLQLTDKPAPPATGAYRFQKVVSAERDKSYTPAKVLKGLLGPLPMTVLNYSSGRVTEALAGLLAQTTFDAVVLESIHLFPYLDTIRNTARPPSVLLDWHNIESELMNRFASGAANPLKKAVAVRTAHLLEKLEDAALRSLDAHTVVSERERQKLLSRAPKARIHVVANGVATNTFTPAPEAGTTLLFVGSMDYHANSEAVIWFCRQVWPRLSATFPHLFFKIVGRNPPASVRSLANDRITVTGSVPDVRPYYREALAVAAPLLVGGGTRLKILEAMAAGVPVVSTHLGAEGLDLEHGREILLADTPAALANAIESLIQQPGLSLRLREAARRVAVERYDWSVSGAKLNTAILSSC